MHVPSPSYVWLLVSGSLLIPALTLLPGRESLLIRNSLWLAASSFTVAWPIASLLAISATCLGRRQQLLFWCCIAFLLFLPLQVQAAAWDLRDSLSRQTDTEWDSAWWAASVGHGVAAIPWLTWLSAWQLSLPAFVADSLRLDATAGQALWHGLLPRLASTLPIALWWILIQTFTDITLTDLYQVRTYAEEIYVGYSLGEGLTETTPRAAAWSGIVPALFGLWLMMSSCMAVGHLAHRFAGDGTEPDSTGPWTGNRTVQRCAAVFAVGVMSALVLLPLVTLMARAGMQVTWQESEPIRHWSLTKLFLLTRGVPWDFAAEFGWTVLLSQCAALGGIIAAGIWSVLARQSAAARWSLCVAVACSLFVPGPVVGLMLDRWGTTWGAWLYDRTVVLPVVALGWHILPWQAAIVWFGVSSLPADQWDQARLQGATIWQLWIRIAVPQRASCLITAWLVGFLLASSDLSTSILVMPPGISTISVRLFGLLHAAADDRVAAICLFVSGSVAAATLATVLFWHRFVRSMRRRSPLSYTRTSGL